MVFKSISKANVKDKFVLLRVDINSPVVKKKPLDNPRIKESAETIKHLIKNKAKLVIIAHQGRKGDADFIPLKDHARLLSKYSKSKIKYVDYLFEIEAIREIKKLKKGSAILLKNVREYEDEKNTDAHLNRYHHFSKHFDLFVNDAFSVSHRKQGSIIIPPKEISAFAGISLQNEISALSKFNLNDKKTIFFVGGSKIEDYLPIFDNLDNKNNKVIASGLLANLFIIATGKNLGFDNVFAKENGYMEIVPKLKEILDKYKEQIILPVDFAVEGKGKKREEHLLAEFPIKKKILDVGHKSVEIFIRELQEANAIFMKGPLGYSELKEFSYATTAVLNEISKATKSKKIFSLLGGGHLTTTVEKYKIPNNFSHVSLSGGALIAFISGQKLPGLDVLER